MKKVLSFILCIVFITTLLPIVPFTASAALPDRGFSDSFYGEKMDTHGFGMGGGSGPAPTDSLTWKLESGTLTISGEGAMKVIPWKNQKSEIKKVIIEEGVTSICDKAFDGCTALCEIVIPNTVKSIGGYAFYNCNVLWEITIPQSVISIGAFAFGGNAAVSRVNIESVAAWCNIDFDGTPIANPLNKGGALYLNGEQITDLVIPEGVTKIKHYAFYNCKSLKSVTIPSSLEYIGERAFENCTAIDKVYIKNVAAWCNIYFGRFCGTSNPMMYGADLYLNNTIVENLLIPNGVERIYSYAFIGAESLKSVTVSEGVLGIDQYAFANCIGLKSIKLPYSIVYIGGQAFYNTKYYNTDTNWNGEILYIGKYLINAKKNITKAVVKEDTKIIADGAFAGSKVSDLTLPEGLMSIGKWAFEDCTSLESVTIPGTVRYIEGSAFINCSSLADVTVQTMDADIGSISVFMGCSKDLLIKCFRDSTAHKLALENDIKCYVTEYKPTSGTCGENLIWTFNGNTLTISGKGVMSFDENPWVAIRDRVKNIVFKKEVTIIEERAFENFTALESITFDTEYVNYEPGITPYYLGMRQIKDYAFAGCVSLKSVAVPHTVYDIGEGAFKNCTMLSSIELEAGGAGNSYVSTIAPYAFENTAFYNDESNWEDGALYIGNHLIRVKSDATEISVKEGTKLVAEGAFADSDALKSVYLSTVDYIGEGAFENCTALGNIEIPAGLTFIRDRAFAGCTALEKVIVYGDTVFYEDVFEGCEKVVLGCFQGSEADMYATENNIPVERSRSGYCGMYATWALDDEGTLTISGSGSTLYYHNSPTPWNQYKREIEKVVIKEGITEIGGGVVSGCPNLTTVIVSKTVKDIYVNSSQVKEVYIEDLAAWCIGGGIGTCSPEGVKLYLNGEPIVDLVVPDGVPYIGSYAFSQCVGLKSVTLPESVKKIYTDAFAWCANIEEFTIKGELEYIGYGAFTRVDKIKEQEGYIVYVGDYVIDNVAGALVHADIREGTTLIAEDAFHVSWDMESVTIPNSVKYICDYAFWGCDKLRSVVIPESVISIGSCAFGWCESLKNIVIPVSVQSMGTAVFRDCSGLTSATIQNGVEVVPNGTFFNCNNLQTVIIADGIKGIESTAFCSCESLKEVIIPKSVTDISVESTFEGCDNVIIYCYRDSYAFLYAVENFFEYCLMGETMGGGGGGGATKPKQTVGLTNFKAVNEYKSDFTDVASDSWYFDSVKVSYEFDLVKGAAEGKFNPDGNMTIAEAVTLAARIHSIYNTGKAEFTQGAVWYQVYADYAVEKGIIEENQFTDYNRPATRAEFAEIFAKAISEKDYNAINKIEAGDIPDVAESDAVYLLYNAGIVAGSDEAHSFKPETNIKRCEVATIITRIVNKENRVNFEIK